MYEELTIIARGLNLPEMLSQNLPKSKTDSAVRQHATNMNTVYKGHLTDCGPWVKYYHKRSTD